MSFAAPGVLVAGLAVLIVLVAGLRRADRRRRADLERFASGHVLADLTADVSQTRRRVKRALVVSGIGLVLLALAGPEVGHRFEESRRRGIDVLIAVDVSRSMLAGDVQPNRLERAKLAVADLVGQLGDRVGLIAFAGTAFLQCPLTLDQRAFDESLAALEPDLIPKPGSDLASAIHVAEQALATEKRNVKLLVMLSDGEDLGGDAVETAREAGKDGLRIFTVGVGTPAGELIPVPSEGGGTDFVKDAQGRIVKSRLDEKTLTEVAEATGGFYVPLGPRGEGIEAIRTRALDPIPKEELAARMRRVPQNRYQWPLLAGFVLLLVEPLVSDRRRIARAGAPAALAAVLALALALPAPGRAASPAQAKRLYDAGKYAEARDAYRTAHEADPENHDLDFNLGAAAYQAGDFADAAAAFARALQSEQPARQQQSFYNLGNTQFRLGEAALGSNPQQAMAAWQQALEAYDQALALDAEDADAKANRELVEKALEELRQQQEQQQQQDQQQQDQQQQDQQQQDQPQQDQPQQDQQQQDQQQQDQQQQDQQQQSRSGEQQPDRQQDQSAQPRSGDAQEQEKEREEKTGQPEAASEPSPGEEQPRQAEEARAPGRMTPTEARQLLDSLRDEERSLPMMPAQPGEESGQPSDQAVRDW